MECHRGIRPSRSNDCDSGAIERLHPHGDNRVIDEGIEAPKKEALGELFVDKVRMDSPSMQVLKDTLKLMPLEATAGGDSCSAPAS